MINIVVSSILVFTILGCSAPKPPQVFLTKNLKPINFTTTNYNNVVIKSQQVTEAWRKQFIYSIDRTDYSPEFFYATAHADRIIARIKPPFIDFVFTKVRENLRNYGIATQLELMVIEDDQQNSQVILDCMKLNDKQ